MSKIKRHIDIQTNKCIIDKYNIVRKLKIDRKKKIDRKTER